MCGVVAVALRRPAPDVGARVERALGALTHRGPDASGSRTLSGDWGCVVLGATRLRILDLSPAADQPMASADGRVWVAYNGELYNHVELRHALERDGVPCRTDSDTEVLANLCAREAHPLAPLPLLRGMFAFASFDAVRQRLVVARDRLGIKPAYYAALPDGGLAVASEVRALVAAGLVSGAPDRDAVCAYLRWGVVPAPLTILDGVRSVLPGHALVWTPSGTEHVRWWEPQLSDDPDLAEPEVAHRVLGAALEDAVRRHLVADRPVGVFLSGGIDSTAVAALARRCGGAVRALTVVFPDAPGDERTQAAAVATSLGAGHVTVPVSGSDLAALADAAFRGMDQPTLDGVNTWLVCRAAAGEGLVVCLSGVGGDELFGGYASFRLVPRVRRWRRATALLPALVRRSVVRAASRAVPGGRLVRALDGGTGQAASYAAVRGLFSPQEVTEMLGGSPGEERALPEADVSTLELQRYLPDQLLRDSDSVSMAHSLEMRVPLLDDVVVDVALAIPAPIRHAAGKRCLARAVGIEAPAKRPFALPFEQWLRGPMRERLREALLSESLPLARELRAATRRRLHGAFVHGRVHWSRVWAVAVLRQWPVANGLSW